MATSNPAATSESRSRLSQQIDDAVENHVTDELLGRLVKQALDLRYYGGEVGHLQHLIDSAIERKAKELIGLYLQEADDSLWDGVVARLKDVHTQDIATVITDEFMADLAMGNR